VSNGTNARQSVMSFFNSTVYLTLKAPVEGPQFDFVMSEASRMVNTLFAPVIGQLPTSADKTTESSETRSEPVKLTKTYRTAKGNLTIEVKVTLRQPIDRNQVYSALEHSLSETHSLVQFVEMEMPTKEQVIDNMVGDLVDSIFPGGASFLKDVIGEDALSDLLAGGSSQSGSDFFGESFTSLLGRTATRSSGMPGFPPSR